MTTDTGRRQPRWAWLARLVPQGEVDLDRAALPRTHEAVVVWPDSPSAGSTLQAAAIEALRARGGHRDAGRAPGRGAAVGLGRRARGRHREGSSPEAIARALSVRRLQAAFGTPGAGVAGFARSHREAQRAERVERLRREAGRDVRTTTAYADVATVALMATDLEAAGDYVRRELGALAESGAAMEALRTTLFHYLGAERGLAEVARRLHVARATVTYRVKRAQEVLGHDSTTAGSPSMPPWLSSRNWVTRSSCPVRPGGERCADHGLVRHPVRQTNGRPGFSAGRPSRRRSRGVDSVMPDAAEHGTRVAAHRFQHAGRHVMINQEAFAELMSGVCTPVTVVTATAVDGRPYGSTVSSFASLSLAPPLVSFALDRSSRLLTHIPPGARVGVNILGAHQQDLASTFARRHQGPGSKFDNVTWTVRAGLPYLPESAGWTAGRVERHVDGGDHILLVVGVEEAESAPTPPLIYARRTFGTHSGLAVAS